MNATIINLLLKAKQILMCDEKKFEQKKNRNNKLNGTESQWKEKEKKTTLKTGKKIKAARDIHFHKKPLNALYVIRD